jgi:hypothetical protein
MDLTPDNVDKVLMWMCVVVCWWVWG